MTTSSVNKEIDQDRVFDTVDHFEKWGDPLAKQDRRIYSNLRNRWDRSATILEAGCGNGVGSYMLNEYGYLVATDKTERNIQFARTLYPFVQFTTWNINEPWPEEPRQIVVAVEVFEHVANPQAAMDNLLAAATEEVWLSTPNGTGKPRPPENPYHVCEYTPKEIFDMVPTGCKFSIHNWETFDEIKTFNTDVHPLVYRIRKTK